MPTPATFETFGSPHVRRNPVGGGNTLAGVTASAEAHILATAALVPGEDPQAPIDREEAFLVYASLSGNVSKTASVLHIPETSVLRLVDAGQWDAKLASVFKLKESHSASDIERGLNRTMSFVQAHRMRLFLNRVMMRFINMTNEELDSFCILEEEDSKGNIKRKLSARAFADLASAMEKTHAMTYYALADTASERRDRSENPHDMPSATDVHTKLAEAMAAVRADTSPAALLASEQLAAVATASARAQAGSTARRLREAVGTGMRRRDPAIPTLAEITGHIHSGDSHLPDETVLSVPPIPTAGQPPGHTSQS